MRENYVNGMRTNLKKLDVGDTIFIEGLTIIWMNSFICVNNPDNMLKIAGLNLVKEEEKQKVVLMPVSEDDKIVELYGPNDYYVPYPTIREHVKDDEIVIDAPPEEDKQDGMPWILSMGSSMMMTASAFTMAFNVGYYVQNGADWIRIIPQAIMCLSMLIGGLLMPRIANWYQKKQRKKRENLRQTKYTKYLNDKARRIELLLNNESQILNDTYLNSQDCINALEKRTNNFWHWQVTDEDFLTVRLGTGRQRPHLEIKAPEEHFTLDEDDLLNKVYELKSKYEYIDNVPVVISLRNYPVTSFISSTFNNDFINEIISQLITLQSSIDLKIVIFTSDVNLKYWEYMKYIPHVFADDKSIRFFAASVENAKAVSNYLEEVLKSRKESKNPDSITSQETIYMPHYLIITDDYKKYKNINIINEIVEKNGGEFGFSLSIFEKSIKQVPINSTAFVEYTDDDGVIIEKQAGLNNQAIFKINKPEYSLNMSNIAINLAAIPVNTKDGQAGLPSSIAFLDMYGVSKIEQLNVLNRWRQNNPVISLNTIVGVHPNGDNFELDLHEKYHGPHGLIAGATGSGKSEFIITWILSMAINYHPYEVQFVLIDYKGGGLAGAFENKENKIKIPHLVGTITNLDVNTMNRSLTSIQSEIIRRQKIFNEVRENLGEGTIDIYKYQKLYRDGVVSKPLSHLFIVCDEFAELKQQQPDFMQNLISVSRIGRSLGVHLILATQKPSGVVNDQIWANSKFKVCLKVQDREDSMEMLKRPDAASITDVGRFYLQVGYDELFEIGQSGWSGAKYTPSDKIVVKVDESINYINDIGYILKSIKEKTTDNTSNVDYGDQLINIVKYINHLGEKEQLKINPLWLDIIPALINIEEVKKKYGYKPQAYYINPAIGEYDDPVNQSKSILNIDLSKKGNLVVYGLPGTGKETLLTNLIRSTIIEHTPDEVSVYVIDCGSGSLQTFNSFPHVGDVITVDDSEKITDLFKMIDQEIEHRKDLFVDYAGSYNEYIENSGQKLNVMLVVINNYDIFAENYANETELLQSMFRDGYKYGVVFAVSAISTTVIKSRSMSYFNNKICMRLADPTDYRMILNAPKELTPAEYFGRGIVQLGKNAYEFQTAMFASAKDQVNSLRELSKLLNASYTTRARPIPTIPKEVTVNSLLDKVTNSNTIPVGFNMDTKGVSYYELLENKISIISYSIFDEVKQYFVRALAKLLSINSKVYLIDLNNAITKGIKNVELINNDYDSIVNIIATNMQNVNDQTKKYYLFVGAGALKKKLSAEKYADFEKICSVIEKSKNNYFIVKNAKYELIKHVIMGDNDEE